MKRQDKGQALTWTSTVRGLMGMLNLRANTGGGVEGGGMPATAAGAAPPLGGFTGEVKGLGSTEGGVTGRAALRGVRAAGWGVLLGGRSRSML